MAVIDLSQLPAPQIVDGAGIFQIGAQHGIEWLPILLQTGQRFFNGRIGERVQLYGAMFVCNLATVREGEQTIIK